MQFNFESTGDANFDGHLLHGQRRPSRTRRQGKSRLHIRFEWWGNTASVTIEATCRVPTRSSSIDRFCTTQGSVGNDLTRHKCVPTALAVGRESVLAAGSVKRARQLAPEPLLSPRYPDHQSSSCGDSCLPLLGMGSSRGVAVYGSRLQ